MSDETDDAAIGYGKPPRHSRFRKGQSGNPRGRPKGKKAGIPYETVLGQMVTLRDGGQERRITAAEAFLLQLSKQGLEGDGAAARASLAAIEEARRRRITSQEPEGISFISVLMVGFNANQALEALRMARKLYRKRPTARMKLEPWIVEAALARLDAPLSPDEQRTVLAATRTPRKVNWPDWWEVGLE
ncbi:hypothetical protein EI983_09780 [Roseovarius faecimaris]|uniref:DUF5681 domain-containing protein n=1 Tax=Roseovarius faecimaris TaxID=2494550 RepID=A0A6I6INC9_9RHOB|nr:DUF5681 domain-containing protein [Roseovarius faecimaris]QGX98549.1 hypothetical protein EI983_09780 [Roseovarius faecimaris]